jgi:predicted ribosomally synthesized peptide with nif11-like leader
LAMSEEQLSALLAKLKDDAGLQEKLKGAADLDTAVAMAKEAGFDVSKADWLRYQAKQTSGKLSDEELESVAGGSFFGEMRRLFGGLDNTRNCHDKRMTKGHSELCGR